MLAFARRRVLAVTLAGLGFRRAAALPVPVKPDLSPSRVCTSGWWVGPGNWAYHQEIGWMHSFLPMHDLKPAEWYGPPPPRPAPIPFDWGKVMKG